MYAWVQPEPLEKDWLASSVNLEIDRSIRLEYAKNMVVSAARDLKRSQVQHRKRLGQAERELHEALDALDKAGSNAAHCTF